MATRQSLTSSFHIRYAQEGEAACILALSNEVEMVACDGLGNVSDVDSIEGTAWTFYVGNTALDASNYTYEVVADGCTVSTSVSGSVGTIAVSAMRADTATVTVKVTYNGTAYTREYTLTKNYANISYHIAASPSVLKVDSNGKVTTSSLDFSIRVYDNGEVTTYTDLTSSGEARTKYGLYAYYALGSGTLRNPDTDSDGCFALNSDIVTQAYSSGLTLYLYQGGTYSTGTLVDQETLETVQNGSDGSDGNDGQDGEDAVTYSLLLTPSLIVAAEDGTLSSSTIAISVIMAAGKSTTVMSTYSDITAAGLSLKVKANGSSTYSDLSSVSLSASTYTDAQGGTVMLCDEDGDVQDYQSFAILQEASSACNLLLSNEAAAVACDDEGNVTGSFQSTSWAFYVGSEDVTPYLLGGSLDGGSYAVSASGCTYVASGEVITPTGMSADTATIAVAVTYNGLEYTKVYTLTKVYAGSNGTSVVRGTCEGWWQTWAAIYSTIASSVSAGDTNVTWLCNEIGSTSSGTATASGAPYYATLDSDGNYTTGVADTGTCYICDDEGNEDQHAHVFVAEATGWSDLGQMTGITGEDGEDADFYQLVDGSVADGSTAHASYATVAIAYDSEGETDTTVTYDDDGNVASVSVNQQLTLHLYVALQHVVGDTVSYVTDAEVTASLATDVGNSSFDLENDGSLYYYEGTYNGLTSDDIPSSILVQATCDGGTYYMSVPVTFSAKGIVEFAEDYYLIYYQNQTSFSQLALSAATISALVKNTTAATRNLFSGLADGSGWTNADGGTTYVAFDNTSYSGLAGLRFTSSGTYLYSPMIYLAAGQEYTISFYTYGSTTAYDKLYYATSAQDTAADVATNGENIELTWESTGESATFLYGSSSTGTYNRYKATFKAPATGWYVLTHTRGTSYWCVCPQLEAGDTATDWVPGNTASEGALALTSTSIVAKVEDEFSSAGINITSSTVTIDASKVYILNGTETAALFENGKISATYLDVDSLVADYIESNTAVLGSVFTEYLQSSSAVLGNVTIEGSIVYAQHVLNKGTEEDYLYTVTDTCGTISGSANVAAYVLDVCTLDGTLVIERVVGNTRGFHLPFMCVFDNNYLRGYTQYNSSAWRAMSFTDFRRLIGRELTIINNTGLGSLCLFIGYYYFIGNDTEPTTLSDGIYYLPAGGAKFAIDYSSKYGYIWRVSVESAGASEQTPEQYFMDSQGVGNWDLPDGQNTIDQWRTGEWTSSGTLSESSSTSVFAPESTIQRPDDTAKVSIQTVMSKTIDSTTYHYTIRSIYGHKYSSDGTLTVSTILSPGGTALNSDFSGELKLGGDGTVYRADVDIEDFDYIAVSFRVFTETSGTPTTGYTGLVAATAILGTNVDLSNLKILFY